MNEEFRKGKSEDHFPEKGRDRRPLAETETVGDLRGMFNSSRILVAPLDWGLGHAARCVPIIRKLIELDAVPVIGADKGPLALLREEFPELEHVPIPGMEVRYGSGRSQAWAMVKQFPAMLRQVREEELFFKQIRPGLRVDAVISDQRFGIRAAGIPSVLITHQVFPFFPFGQGLARQINRRHIDHFDRCWVPDHALAPGFVGELSHGSMLPENVRYIGPVSRFSGLATPDLEHTYRIVAVISGPEPQRSLFEQLLIDRLPHIPGEHLIVGGTPEKATTHQVGNITMVGHLNANALHQVITGAELIIARTGYTTLMDLDALGRAALLVPTPGQSEQEYLGLLHRRNNLHRIRSQDALDMLEVLNDPPSGIHRAWDPSPLMAAMTDLATLVHGQHPSTFTSR